MIYFDEMNCGLKIKNNYLYYIKYLNMKKMNTNLSTWKKIDWEKDYNLIDFDNKKIIDNILWDLKHYITLNFDSKNNLFELWNKNYLMDLDMLFWRRFFDNIDDEMIKEWYLKNPLTNTQNLEIIKKLKENLSSLVENVNKNINNEKTPYLWRENIIKSFYKHLDNLIKKDFLEKNFIIQNKTYLLIEDYLNDYVNSSKTDKETLQFMEDSFKNKKFKEDWNTYKLVKQKVTTWEIILNNVLNDKWELSYRKNLLLHINNENKKSTICINNTKLLEYVV